eukprot:5088542-Prymnesium_polylepis.1
MYPGTCQSQHGIESQRSAPVHGRPIVELLAHLCSSAAAGLWPAVRSVWNSRSRALNNGKESRKSEN